MCIRDRSYVVPIPKPGKDTSDPTNYRPIALTSCVCKVMERMVNNRLVWYLEINKIITPTQSGFRKGRSTTDQLVRLESYPRGFYPEATRYCYFIWSRKGVRRNLEVWHLERLTRCWSTRPTPTFHSWLPLRQKVPSQSWWKLFQTLWTGNGVISKKHPICYFVLFEN